MRIPKLTFVVPLILGAWMISLSGCSSMLASAMHEQNVHDLQGKRMTPEEFHQREDDIHNNLR